MLYAFGDSQTAGLPFTAEELGWMNAVMAQVDARVEQERSDIFWAYANPLNSLLETQRDARARAQMLFDADVKNAQQLHDSLGGVVESMDPDKYRRWMDLANTIIDPGAARIFNEQISYASTAQTVGTVAADTAHDITTPSGWPWWMWAVGGLAALSILGPYVGLLNRKEK